MIAHDKPAPLGGVELPAGDGERKSRAFGEKCDRNAVGQSHRVEHELECDLGARHLAFFEQRLAARHLLEVLLRLLVTYLAQDALRKRQLGMRAGANAEVIAKLPIVE